MKEEIVFKKIKLTETQKKARASRALGVGVTLVLLIFMLYGVSLVRLLGA